MPKIISQLNKSAPEYGQYREHNLALRDTLKEKLDRIAHGGGEAAEARLRDKGKLPVRERIQHLLDPGSPFLELSALAADGVSTLYECGPGKVLCGLTKRIDRGLDAKPLESDAAFQNALTGA